MDPLTMMLLSSLGGAAIGGISNALQEDPKQKADPYALVSDLQKRAELQEFRKNDSSSYKGDVGLGFLQDYQKNLGKGFRQQVLPDYMSRKGGNLYSSATQRGRADLFQRHEQKLSQQLYEHADRQQNKEMGALDAWRNRTLMSITGMPSGQGISYLQGQNNPMSSILGGMGLGVNMASSALYAYRGRGIGGDTTNPLRGATPGQERY